MNTEVHHPRDTATTSAHAAGGDPAPAAPASAQTARWLALGAVAGPVLFTLAWIVLGPLRPGYSPVSQPISALAIGPNGVYMHAAFLLNGLLGIVGVVAVFQGARQEVGAIVRWTCAVLLLLSPLGFLWAGIFTMDHLALHNVGAQLAMSTPIISFLIVGLLMRRSPSWRRFGAWMLLGSPLALALLIGFTMSVPLAQLQTGAGGGSFGLWQRALAIKVQAWFVALGWRAFRGV